jgi:aminopeptidase N
MSLTHQRASARSQLFKKGSIFYDYHVSTEAGTHYEGVAELRFELVKVPDQLPIDFRFEQLKKFIVNGKQIEPKQEDGFLLVEAGDLKEGANEVIVWYRNRYDNDGSGCVSFIDVDQKQYIYTQFEAYFANRTFPVFDQPDLKAKMRLSVLTPADWKRVISNENASVDMKPFNLEEFLGHIHSTNKELVTEFLKDFKGNMTVFPETKLLPCYLFAFVAGAYEELKLEHPYKVLAS